MRILQYWYLVGRDASLGGGEHRNLGVSDLRQRSSSRRPLVHCLVVSSHL